MPGSNEKKNKAHYKRGVWYNKVPSFFYLTHFRGKGRNPSKNLVYLLGDLKTPKLPSEIIWPLQACPSMKYEPTEQGLVDHIQYYLAKPVADFKYLICTYLIQRSNSINNSIKACWMHTNCLLIIEKYQEKEGHKKIGSMYLN